MDREGKKLRWDRDSGFKLFLRDRKVGTGWEFVIVFIPVEKLLSESLLFAAEFNQVE